MVRKIESGPKVVRKIESGPKDRKWSESVETTSKLQKGGDMTKKEVNSANEGKDKYEKRPCRKSYGGYTR